ncbi:MAG: YHYH protein [Verrucomicrobiota bacterium]
MKKPFLSLQLVFLFFITVGLVGQGPPPFRPGSPPPGGKGGAKGRVHTANESRPLELVRADRNPPSKSRVSIQEESVGLVIEANGIPNHRVGSFPNRGNPHTIQEQGYDIVLPEDPEPAAQVTSMTGTLGFTYRVFGISLDGVLFEPGTAETWKGRRDSGWNYEALGGAVTLGLDANFAHVQPDGSYHYHGLPLGLMRRLGHQTGDHSPLIGWAADGFPIYALYGYEAPQNSGSKVVELKTSYQLRRGQRPRGGDQPGGEFDGTFIQDYHHVIGSGDLDECNGRFCVTPEFPDGTYAYFLTRDWPVIPRAFKGTPVSIKAPGGGSSGGPRGPGAMRSNPPR